MHSYFNATDMASTKINRYGIMWDDVWSDLAIEFRMIQKGGYFKGHGNGLFYHYKRAMSLLWPKDDWHRWADLALKTIVENDVTVFLGAGDSGKTWTMSKYVLVDWWAFPDDTLWLVSSTEYRGAELRIWGTIKKLFNWARDRWDEELCGTVLESMHAITTESISDDRSRARSLQRGLIFVPCKKGGDFVGLSAFVGAKAPRLRHAGDEVQFLDRSFLDAYSNWYGKHDFKGIMAGNPLDPTDSLCYAAEPEGGWDNWSDTEKTQTWRSKFYNAAVAAFDGRDSPNLEFPADKPTRYPYLIGRKKMEAVAKTHGESSWQFWNQCAGKPNAQMVIWRVVTRQLCLEHHALEKVEWLNTKHTWIYGLDPTYGGEDRCVGGAIEFGEGLDGKQIIKFYPPEIIAVSVRKGTLSAEDQIALHVKKRLEDFGIPPENCFYDSTGKGTLGGAFARAFGPASLPSPIPVDSGGNPTERPVRFDLWTGEGQERRLVTCREHYSKFVSEMWFSVREAIEGDQVRELPEDVLFELSMRKYGIVKGNKTEVEKKEDLKERLHMSPDLGDWSAIAVEGARQRGFKIYRLGADATEPTEDDYFSEEAERYEMALKDAMLIHT